MNFVAIILNVILLIKLSDGNNGKINEGASTSAADDEQDSQLSNHEKCEISNYVKEALNLVTAELMSDNTRSMRYVWLITKRLKYGQSKEVLENYEQRRKYFISVAMNSVMDKILDIMAYNFTQCFLADNLEPEVFNRDPLLEDIDGSDLYDLMSEILSRLGLTEEEINAEEYNILGHVTKSSSRSERSLDSREEKCYPLRKYSWKRWKQLILYLSRTLIKYHSNKESSDWSCDFILLYHEYKSQRLQDASNVRDDCVKPTFSNFLYSKSSQIPDWSDCIDYAESKKPGEWCLAWRRLMLNSDLGTFGRKNKNKHPEKFNQDLKTIINWLWKNVSQQKPTKSRLKIISENLVCYKNTISLSCPNSCKSSGYRVTSGKARRSISLEDDIFYEREWSKDVGRKLRCRCPEDNSTSSTVSPPNSGNWLSRLFGKVFKSRCDEGSPDRNLPRCDEFRRKRSVS